MLDIFSRNIVAWTIDTVECDATVVKRLITTACARQGIDADQLILHSDRDAQTTSTTIAELLETLGVGEFQVLVPANRNPRPGRATPPARSS